MMHIAANTPYSHSCGNDIPCCATLVEDNFDDFSIAATLKQSNVTIKVRSVLDILASSLSWIRFVL
jgi:hypothetical protein